MEFLSVFLKELPVPVLITIGVIVILVIFSESIVRCICGFVIALVALIKGHEEIEYFETRIHKRQNNQPKNASKNEEPENVRKAPKGRLQKIIKSVFQQNPKNN